jgi:hypothetical protein
MAIDVVIEAGKKRTFAAALAWPGWCRAGHDEDEALAALLTSAPRYAAVLGTTVKGFRPPASTAELVVVERLQGNATTDFGAPGAVAADDDRSLSREDVARLSAILLACWAAFDRAATAAEGTVLATGPRGGGRDLTKIRAHLAESDAAYLAALGGKAGRGATHEEVRERFVEGLGARARGDLPDVGPRGGKRWPAGFAARRAAWHALDHAWEIEDRST